MHAAVCELDAQDERFESQLEDGKPIEVCFSGIWYPATVVRTIKERGRLYYRLESEASRRLNPNITIFGLRPVMHIYPKGHEGDLIIRHGVNVRART